MKQKEILIILIPSFVLTILWVIFTIYHNHVTSTIKNPLTIQIIPIEGKFDTNTIEALKNRQRINPLYEIESVPTPIPDDILLEEIYPTVTPEPTPEPTSELDSGSGTDSADQEITP